MLLSAIRANQAATRATVFSGFRTSQRPAGQSTVPVSLQMNSGPVADGSLRAVNAGIALALYSDQSSSSSSGATSSSIGSRPTTSKAAPQSGHSTRSPLSTSSSTCTSASHSGQLPLGISSPLQIRPDWWLIVSAGTGHGRQAQVWQYSTYFVGSSLSLLPRHRTVTIDKPA